MTFTMAGPMKTRPFFAPGPGMTNEKVVDLAPQMRDHSPIVLRRSDRSCEKGWDGNMKRLTWCLLTTGMLLGGCAAPGVRGTSLGDKPVLAASLGDRPLFAVVTDGSPGSYGVRDFLFVTATYDGQIIDRQSGKVMEFHATSGGKTLRLGERHYDLAEGRLFLVSVATDPFRVQQLEASDEDLQHPATADERITTFFQGAKAQ